MKEIKYKIRDEVLTEFCGELIKVEIYGIEILPQSDEVIYKVRGNEEHNYFFDEQLMERFLFRNKEEAKDILIYRKEQLEKLIESI